MPPVFTNLLRVVVQMVKVVDACIICIDTSATCIQTFASCIHTIGEGYRLACFCMLINKLYWRMKRRLNRIHSAGEKCEEVRFSFGFIN